MKLSSLIKDAAAQAHAKGHRLKKFKTHKDGAVSSCVNCGLHVRTTTIGDTIFGKAYSERCKV